MLDVRSCLQSFHVLPANPELVLSRANGAIHRDKALRLTGRQILDNRTVWRFRIQSSGLDPQAGAEYWTDRVKAPLAELVDAPHSKCGSERSSGSSPEGGTITSFYVIPVGPKTSKKPQICWSFCPNSSNTVLLHPKDLLVSWLVLVGVTPHANAPIPTI
jgi:hypothetical protein